MAAANAHANIRAQPPRDPPPGWIDAMPRRSLSQLHNDQLTHALDTVASNDRLSDAAVLNEYGAVIERAADLARIRRGEAYKHGRSVLEFARDGGEFLAGTADKSAIHQKVAREIAHEGEFRRSHQVGAFGRSSTGCADDQRSVAFQIAGRRVYL